MKKSTYKTNNVNNSSASSGANTNINRDKYSKIRDVYLRLYDYKFDHGPREANPRKGNSRFVGREKILKRIQLLFDPKHSKSSHGAYLVTGYRGMGKTSLVREGLSKYNNKGIIETFEFFLSQDDVRDIDLLRQIGWKLNDFVKGRILKPSNFTTFLSKLLSFLFFTLCFMILLDVMNPNTMRLSELWTSISEISIYPSWATVLKQAILILVGLGGIFISLLFIVNVGHSWEVKWLKRINDNLKIIIYRFRERKFWRFIIKWQLLKLPIIALFIWLGYKLLFVDAFKLPIEGYGPLLASVSLSILLAAWLGVSFSFMFPGFMPAYRKEETEEIKSWSNWGRNLTLILIKVLFVASILVQLFYLSPEIFKYFKSNLSNLFTGQVGIGRPVLFFALFAFLISAGNAILDRLLYLFPSYKLKKDLENLMLEFQSRLYANVTQEKVEGQPINLGSNNPLSAITGRLMDFFQSKGSNSKNILNYEVASPKEIEQFLFRILGKIDEIRSQHHLGTLPFRWFINVSIPQFVFIVDELDKVEPNYYFSPGDRESDDIRLLHESPISISTKARKRQEAIAKLLANLKGFLNNADAKFIFIGGRGMYDAALADISDRETFYSSIFNEVIYVPSFFKDSITPHSGLSEMTEYFVCQYLLPNFDPDNEYKRLFVEYIKHLNEISNESERFKIIHLLQNFFIFCVYRSNGSPKKLIEIFEKFVVRLDVEKIKKIQKEQSGLVYAVNDELDYSGLFLRFSFKDQYEINLTSNLYRPYLIIHSRHLKSLGDKLLYSSAFLMDHILKFHRTAFSFRNLELIPDIILANKDPNLRRFFQDIMSFLSKMHMRETVNALFQYKFYSRVKNELMYVSKISEFSSAAFNFTLDESYHLKSYYKKKLAAKYKEYEDSGFDKYYIHSIGYLHSVIADLHYYDEEYDDAIIHYTDAIQPFRAVLGAGNLQSNHFVLFTKNSLHLGLCLEKLQSFDKAYSLYRNLVLQIRQVYSAANVADKEWEEPFRRMQLFLRPSVALLNVIEKARPDGITYDNLDRNMSEYLKFLGLEGVKIFPMKDGELTPHYDIFKILNSTQKSRDKKRIFSLITDYYINVGSLLFFKNFLFFRFLYQDEFTWEPTEKEIRSKLDANNLDAEYFPSLSAYIYYLQALRFFMIPYVENYQQSKKEGTSGKGNGEQDLDLTSIEDRSKLIKFFIDDKYHAVLNATEQIILANILGKLGDSLFASVKLDGACTIDKQFLEKANADLFKNIVDMFDMSISTSHVSIERVIAIYLLASDFYKRAGRVQSASLQLKKILYLIRETKSSKNAVDYERSFLTSPIGIFVNNLANNILRGLINVTEVSNRAQIKKFRSMEVKGYEQRASGDPTIKIYNGNSTRPEVREVLLIVETIKKQCIENYGKPKIEIGPHSSISDMYVRVLELKYQSEVEFSRVNKHVAWPVNAKPAGKVRMDIEEKFKNLTDGNVIAKLDEAIINGFFCLYESIRILNTYGVDYIFNYTFLAATHYRLAKFCVLLESTKQLKNSKAFEELRTLIGDSFLQSTGPYYHFDKSIYYNRKAVQMHSGGAAYKVTNRSMYALDDDFNDDFVHFCAAIERFRINMKYVKESTRKTKIYLSDSMLHQYENYVEQFPISPLNFEDKIKLTPKRILLEVKIVDGKNKKSVFEENNILEEKEIDTSNWPYGEYMVTVEMDTGEILTEWLKKHEPKV